MESNYIYSIFIGALVGVPIGAIFVIAFEKGKFEKRIPSVSRIIDIIFVVIILIGQYIVCHEAYLILEKYIKDEDKSSLNIGLLTLIVVLNIVTFKMTTKVDNVKYSFKVSSALTLFIFLTSIFATLRLYIVDASEYLTDIGLGLGIGGVSLTFFIALIQLKDVIEE
ncbi:hypothetical protein [Lysinibacillus xylanilyticus]|uniref:Uncharacterized protein n=1 Tax=Lysinibacillus xylanilyticus TaxID=582475 RepID=A0ABV3VYH2_9BACI